MQKKKWNRSKLLNNFDEKLRKRCKISRRNFHSCPKKPVAISLHHVHFSFLQLRMITFRIHAKHIKQELNAQHVLIKCVHRFWATLASAESSFAPPRSGEHVWQERRLIFYSRKMCSKRKPTIHWWNIELNTVDSESLGWVGEKLKLFDTLKGEQWVDAIERVTISRGLAILHYKLIQKFDESIVMRRSSIRSQFREIDKQWSRLVCLSKKIQEWIRKSFCKLQHGLLCFAIDNQLSPFDSLDFRVFRSMKRLELASDLIDPAIYGNTPKRPSLN